MFISEEEYEKRINSEKNFLRPVPDKEPIDSPDPEDESIQDKAVAYKRGRKSGTAEVPGEIRALIGAAAVSGTDTLSGLAKTFGVSRRSVANYKNGRNLDEKAMSELEDKREAMLERVKDTALMKTMMIMGMITEKDLKSIVKDRARNLIHIAKGFAEIHEKVSPREINEPQQTVVIFRDSNGNGSTTKDEDHYKVIDVEAVAQ